MALQREACIPTEGGSWVRPADAVLCIGHDMARQLLADPNLESITRASYVDRRLTVLHQKADLAKALGVKQLDLTHLLTELEKMHHKELFPKLGQQWCAQMLACFFDVLAEQEPALRSMRLQTTGFSSRVQDVVNSLCAKPLFLLSSGEWSSVSMASGGTLLKPVVSIQQPPSMGEQKREAQPTAVRRQQQHSVESVLAHCGLEAETLQLGTVAAGFVEAAGVEHRESLLRMMQASVSLLQVHCYVR